jgi:hypothetical protein
MSKILNNYLIAAESSSGKPLVSTGTVNPSFDSAPLGGFKNKIINGDFDIWQRGTITATALGDLYLSDRWMNSSFGSTYVPTG